jgi:hypothetical protein
MPNMASSLGVEAAAAPGDPHNAFGIHGVARAAGDVAVPGNGPKMARSLHPLSSPPTAAPRGDASLGWQGAKTGALTRAFG